MVVIVVENFVVVGDVVGGVFSDVVVDTVVANEIVVVIAELIVVVVKIVKVVAGEVEGNELPTGFEKLLPRLSSAKKNQITNFKQQQGKIKKKCGQFCVALFYRNWIYQSRIYRIQLHQIAYIFESSKILIHLKY